MEHQLQVKRAGEFDYKIVWERDFTRLCDCIRDIGLLSQKACIVTDGNVDGLYTKAVMEQLKQVFDLVTVYVMPAGEQHKTLDTVKQLYTHLIVNHYDRKDLLISLGGGVVGDLTGFAAATYLRGIDFIQLPTTLLSQVDSSIGGKTGVDFDQFKNMVGAFHQPRLVYMNMATLNTLPEDQFYGGMGEILKSGLLKDAAYFHWVMDHSSAILKRDPDTLTDMIMGSCKIKKEVVENDPTEQGERALLNLGHTIGHAIEKLKDFQMLHGECVALGTIAAAYLSKQKGYLSQEDLQLIEKGNERYHLPLHVGGLSAEDILAATKSDKKMEHGKIKFILLQNIGHAVIDKSITDAELLDAVSYILSNK